MIARCFECGGSVEADDLAELARVFVDHGKAEHQWEYPEAAVRSYACNYAEAVERLSDDIERRGGIGEITIHPVDESRIADWKRFFDHIGFAGNPDWASCYCLEPHIQCAAEEPCRPWREIRSKMIDRLLGGRTFGYLAYARGEPAGWVNASMRSEYVIYEVDEEPGVNPSAVIGVSCFVIAPPYRRHGVASALLDRAISDAPSRGAAWIEAYPHNSPDPGEPGHFRGPRSMYDARGFEQITVREHYTVMRRRSLS